MYLVNLSACVKYSLSLSVCEGCLQLGREIPKLLNFQRHEIAIGINLMISGGELSAERGENAMLRSYLMKREGKKERVRERERESTPLC